MKISKKIFVLIVCLLATLCFNLDNVFAGNNANGGGKGDSGPCAAGAKCYSGTSGVRVTFVTYKNGKTQRCKYNNTTGELCADSGTPVESIDYWGNTNEFKNIDSNYCHSFKKKYTKSESLEKKIFTSAINESDIQECSQYKYSKTLSEVGFTVKPNPDENYGTRQGITIKNSLTDFAAKLDDNPKDTQVREILNNLIKDATNDNLSINDVSLDNNVYIQFEQLMQITSYKSKTEGIGAIGTVAETTYLLQKTQTLYKTQCLTRNNNTGFKVTPSPCEDWQSTAYGVGYWTGWYGDATLNKKGIAGNLDLPVVTSSEIPGLVNGDPQKKASQDLTKFYAKNSANVMNVWFDPTIVNTCDATARTIQVDSFNSNYELIISEQEYYKKLYNDNNTKKCVTKKGDIYQLNDSCSALAPINIKNFKGITVLNACSEVECNDQVTAIKKNYGNDSTLLDTLYDYWQERGKLYPLLKKTMWELLGLDGPTCNELTDKCKPERVTISNCSMDSYFKDSTCWNNNIAYNDPSNPNDYNAYQSSKDLTFSSGECNVYCEEEVMFDLPNDNTSYNTKASRIFKWGKNTNTNDKEFGGMTITRTCKIIKQGNGGICTNNSFNPTYWVSDIATKLNLNYNEPISKTKITATLESVFNSADINLNGSTKYSVDNDSSYYNCNGKCGNILNDNEFTVEANFSFIYPESLHWFSDKTDNFELKSLNELTNSSLSKNDVLNSKQYIEIGYGLPTAFKSPTVTYNTYSDTDGYSLITSNPTDKGYMYINIENIGTKNNDGTYHFDRLIKYTSDNDSNIGYNNDSTITYGCDYSIKNEIFGYECLSGNSNSDDCSETKSPTGIDVVFRTIQLISTKDEISQTFPGRAGNGRTDKIGRNWNNLGEDKIVELLNNNVYDNEPMYHINLNASTIQEIRKLNKKADNPYTNMNSIPSSYSGNSNDGYTGYYYNNDGSVFSIFLEYLKSTNKLESICIRGNNISEHEPKCNQ